METLQAISNETLVSNLDDLRAKELQCEHDIVRHLEQMETRGLYRDLGFSSLFYYCTKRLKYSAAGAQRRIEAARCLKKHPEVYGYLKSNELTLSAVAVISKVVVKENKPELITQALGKPIQEVERLVAEHLPPEKQRRDTVRVRRVVVEERVETRVSMTIEFDSDLMALYEKAKSYMGPCAPREVFGKLLREFVAKKEQIRSTPVRKVPVRKTLPSAKSRYVRRSVRAEVSQRDGHRCSFVAPDGTRCDETHRLEFDHIVPFINGGSQEASNLRLLCRAHNQLHAERCFGREFVQSHFRSGNRECV